MTETDVKNDLGELIRDIGPAAWTLYTIMIADSKDNICELTQESLGERLGVSRRTIHTLIGNLEKASLAVKKRGVDGYVYHMTTIRMGSTLLMGSKLLHSSIKVLDLILLKDFKDLKTLNGKSDVTSQLPLRRKKESSTDVVFSRWCSAYQERYESEYRVSNFGREKGQLKHLVVKYDNDVALVLAMIDVVMRLYDAKWASTSYLRPTIGSFCSWIAAQAEPFARTSLVAQDALDTTPDVIDDDGDLLGRFDAKFGILGD